MNHPDVPIKGTYFREHGIHAVDQPYGLDHIASFDNWDDTLEALKGDMPYDGNVITPEYATLSNEMFTDIPAHADVITARIRQALDTTKRSEATLHLGTPTQGVSENGAKTWHNSVLSMRRGKIEAVTHKQTLLPAERIIGVSEPTGPEKRYMKRGQAVLICAELFLYAINPGNRLQREKPSQILAPAMWANPVVPGMNARQIEEAGGEDTYYRQQLEKVVGSYLMRELPSVRRVIVSDRGRPDLPPYNAVFDRAR